MTRLVINALATAPGGGLTNLLGLLEGWHAISAALDVVVLASRPETIEALRAAGWGHSVHAVPPRGLMRRVAWERWGLPRLRRRLRADLLLSTNYALAASPCPQIVHHQTLDNFFARGLRPYWRRGARFVLQALAARQALRIADANVFISHYLRRCAEELVPDSRPRNHVIYYGLSELYPEVRERYGDAPRDRHRLCAMQYPADYKDNESLLASLVWLMRMAPERHWRLDIAGWGDFEPWKRRAAELGLAERVDFLGFRNPQQIAAMLNESGCLIYPSVFEGFGLPLIEAMASGCPAVAVNCTTIPEIVQDAAILVPPRSPHALAEAVLRLTDDAELRRTMVQRGLARAAQFSWRRAAAEFCQVFEQVLRSP